MTKHWKKKKTQLKTLRLNGNVLIAGTPLSKLENSINIAKRRTGRCLLQSEQEDRSN